MLVVWMPVVLVVVVWMVVCQAVGANSCKIDTENTPYIKNIKNHCVQQIHDKK